jgi:hypothetical protein
MKWALTNRDQAAKKVAYAALLGYIDGLKATKVIYKRRK